MFVSGYVHRVSLLSTTKNLLIRSTKFEPILNYSTEPLKAASSKIQLTPKKSKDVAKGKGEDGLSNRKRFMSRPVQPKIMEQLDQLNLGLVKNAKYVLKGKANRPLDEPKLQLPPLQFFAGAKVESSIPPPTLPEIAVVGRSNVGKSRLLNTLLAAGAVGVRSGKGGAGAVVRHADRPGVTKQLNFFTCGKLFHLVDMPGYGFAYAKDMVKAEWADIIKIYLLKRPTLKLLYLLIDARHGIKQADREFMAMLTSNSVPFYVIMTKCDMVIRSVLARRIELVTEELKRDYPTYLLDGGVLPISSSNGSGIPNLRRHLLHRLGHYKPIKTPKESSFTTSKTDNLSPKTRPSEAKPQSKTKTRPSEAKPQSKTKTRPSETKPQPKKILTLDTLTSNIYD